MFRLKRAKVHRAASLSVAGGYQADALQPQQPNQQISANSAIAGGASTKYPSTATAKLAEILALAL